MQNQWFPNLAGAPIQKIRGSFRIQLFAKLLGSPLTQARTISQTSVRGPGQQYLDVVADEDPPEVKQLQHGGCIVVYDAVALQDVLSPSDLPGEPAQVKGGVAGQQVWQVAGLAATAASVLLVAFHDGLNLPLLAVGS